MRFKTVPIKVTRRANAGDSGTSDGEAKRVIGTYMAYVGRRQQQTMNVAQNDDGTQPVETSAQFLIVEASDNPGISLGSSTSGPIIQEGDLLNQVGGSVMTALSGVTGVVEKVRPYDGELQIDFRTGGEAPATVAEQQPQTPGVVSQPTSLDNGGWS